MFRKVFRQRYDYHEFEASKILLSKEKRNKGFGMKETIKKQQQQQKRHILLGQMSLLVQDAHVLSRFDK